MMNPKVYYLILLALLQFTVVYSQLPIQEIVDVIRKNPETKLARESASWEGFYDNAKAPVVGGNYATQWTKALGTWLIQSHLFVTLPKE